MSHKQSGQLARLTAICLDDLVSSLGLEHPRFARPLFDLLCLPIAQHFARQIVIYDALVGIAGLQAGHTWLLEQFVGAVDVRGKEQLPASGPLLIVANHPGVSDGSALIAHLARPHLKIMSFRNAFLRELPPTSRYLFNLDDAKPAHLPLIRDVSHHGRDGGALLLFPGGKIEPDPATLPGAVDALDNWSASMDLFARLAPELIIVPAAVRGVFSPRTLRLPLVRLRGGPTERQRLAALLQILVPRLRDNVIELTFGAPLRPAEMAGFDKQRVSRAMLADMRRRLARPGHTPGGTPARSR